MPKARSIRTRAAFTLAVLAAAVLVIRPAAQQQGTGPSFDGRGDRRVEFIDGRPAVEGDILVKFRRAVGSGELGQFAKDVDADESEAVGGAGIHRIHSRSRGAGALRALLRSRSDIEYAEPNYVVTADNVPNDSNFGSLWGLLNNGQTIGNPGVPGADIGATLAWNVSTGSAAIAVGVIDTGIDYTHPDLVANVWSAPAQFTVTIGTKTITCAQNSHGFNAITNSCNPFDDNGHGTHVSGTIGAAGNNNLGVTGVNWTTRLIASKFLDATGTGSIANAINAIEFLIQASAATGANVRVLSNSWSTAGFSQALLDEINRANSANMLFVASAGNNGRDSDVTPNYPSSYDAPNVIAVANTDNTDHLASNSNFGATSVDLAAPGVNILSTYVGDYQYLSGTSMAVPHVSGAAALVLSHCAIDTTLLRQNLLTSVDMIPSLAGKVQTGGRLNVNTAINTCDAFPRFTLSASPASRSLTGAGATTFTVSVVPLNGFFGSVSFDVSGLPPGSSASFSPSTVTTSGSTTLTIAGGGSPAAGNYPLTITGTSAIRTATVQTTLVQELSSPAADTPVSASGNGALTTAPFSTAGGRRLFAFVSSDGPESGSQSVTVTGAGLTWTLVRRANGQAGTSEIWQAAAPTALSNATVTSTQAFGGFDQLLTVVAFSSSSGAGVTAVASAPGGAPAVSLTTTQPGSLVYGVGNDWDSAMARVTGSGQAIVNQWVYATAGDTFWVQSLASPIADAGTLVTLADVEPTADRWNLTAVEIVRSGTSIAVPSVVNSTEAVARTAIVAAGLSVGVVTTVPSATVPSGFVISSTPAAGLPVLPGRAVALVVSSGLSHVAVPNVVALTQSAASSALTAASLTLGTVTTASSLTVPAGSVISQNPTAGTDVIINTAVALVVSSGLPHVAVPNVVALTQAAASSALTGASLTVGTITTASSLTVPAGSVISQTPPAGTDVVINTAVALVVSSGLPHVTVPNVVLLTQAAASSVLTAANLTVGPITRVSSPTVPAGSVISQNPAAGADVEINTPIAVVVSDGLPHVAVPNVVALPQAAASSALTAASLSVGTITTASSLTVAAGSVISQNPAAGTDVVINTEVALVVSSGLPRVAVPNVVALTQAAASSALTAAGLTVGTITTASSLTVPAGSVISQNPAAGADVVINTVVALVVSSGLPHVAVPNVVALTQAAATSALTAATLTVGTITTASSLTVSAGSVISQNPASGADVVINTAVALVVSSGLPHVTVPNVVALTQAAASSALTAASLTLGTVTTASSLTVPAGSVISQNPAAGADVVINTAVALVVSSGLPHVAVPNVVALTQAAASSALTAASLTVGTITTASSLTVPAGSVISQNPAAATDVAINTAVALVVSSGLPHVAVPNVVALTQAAASSALTAASLTVGTVTTASSLTVPAGSVISQNPAAAADVVINTTVALVVSSGLPHVAVPNVVALTQAAASSALTAASLTVGTVTTASSLTVPAGSVISQNPAAGTDVVINTRSRSSSRRACRTWPCRTWLR